MKARDVLPAIWIATIWAGAPMFWHYWLKKPFFLFGATGLQSPHIGGPILFGTAIWAAILTAPEQRTSKNVYAAAGFLLAVSLGLALYVEHSGFLVFFLASYALLRALPRIEGMADAPRKWRDVLREKLWGFARLALMLVAVWGALLYFGIDPMNLIHSGGDKLLVIANDPKSLTKDLTSHLKNAPEQQPQPQPIARSEEETAQIEEELRKERDVAIHQRPLVIEHMKQEILHGKKPEKPAAND